MVNRVVLFLVRRKLKVKKFERFRFDNQVENCTYFFNDRAIKKVIPIAGVHKAHIHESNVSLNWLLNEKCKVILEKYRCIIE